MSQVVRNVLPLDRHGTVDKQGLDQRHGGIDDGGYPPTSLLTLDAASAFISR